MYGMDDEGLFEQHFFGVEVAHATFHHFVNDVLWFSLFQSLFSQNLPFFVDFGGVA